MYCVYYKIIIIVLSLLVRDEQSKAIVALDNSIIRVNVARVCCTLYNAQGSTVLSVDTLSYTDD